MDMIKIGSENERDHNAPSTETCMALNCDDMPTRLFDYTYAPEFDGRLRSS